ncbi:MAG TPA: BatD family protein [Steroidobacteraceae bacterium]|nr:BatD family protein [Steroidobacteraceae bacterium]
MGSGARFFLALLASLLALGPVAASAAGRVTVTLDPSTFSLDESSELTVTITGDEDAAPIIPRVPGLVINPDGQSTSIRNMNGAVSAVFSRTYRVTASQEGTFTIPPIQVGSMRTAAVAVHVTAPGTAAGPPDGAGASGAAHAGAPDVAAAVRAAMPVMKVVVPKSKLYVGELVPIQIKAYFREGLSARLEGPLAAAGDAFTVSGLDKRPTQTEEVVGGIGYTVLTWNSVLGALKSGSYPIGLELPLTINVQLPGSDSDMASRLRALFGTASPGAFMDDSDFNNLFGRVIQRSVTLKPDAAPLTVLPLPVDGRPADFSGAVGQFQAATSVVPAHGAVGDPLTFKLTITGKGNLSRVNSDGLHDLSDWRVYRPESKVTADDDTGLQGLKTFSQPVVPLQTGQLTLPGLSFSYFDPEAGRYVTRTTDPLRVTVTPGAASNQAAPSLQAAAPGAGTPGAAPDTVATEIAASGRYTTTLQPLVWRPWFLGAALTPVALMLAAVMLIRRHQLRLSDPALMLHAARLAAVRINLESMSAALNRGDTPAFFSAARHALQERLADLWQVPAEAVDQALIAQHLPQQSSQLQAIFAMAEKATYAGEQLGTKALQEWQRRVFEQMDRLEAIT